MKKMVLKNKYGVTVCELESTGMFFRVPREEMEDLCTMLEEGDEFKVVSIEVEEDQIIPAPELRGEPNAAVPGCKPG